ncbi:glutathione S-transferase N-terminal domain-containing protein [Halodurantibacterium flavum]|uniref:Glutathione S-transferase N-terminal domain-containing protein n=1 Tax=Halodurantibacterium flavum TaxID=1382802 RepID=A0ABW4SAP4_9RHOB
MDYELAIGDRAYSSWSLRGWLLFDAFGIPCRTRRAQLYTDEFPALLADFAPARTVPALRLPEGPVIADSLAIAEELSSRHPGAGIWPTEPGARAIARTLAAEMHSGFGALRNHCPMNLRIAYTGCPLPDPVLADLRRLETIWDWARAQTRSTGPWLCGAYSAADVFFAPVATRIAGYDLPVGPAAAAYVAAHLAHPSFRRWRAMGLVDGPDQPNYGRDWPTRPWPVPAPLPARAVADGPAENAACPYSGRPVTHFLEMEGRRFGFCNAFCRDKTVADPAVWPTFMALWLGDSGSEAR